jgi:uncharacterized integral membrane protein (TIGR00698 family)
MLRFMSPADPALRPHLDPNALVTAANEPVAGAPAPAHLQRRVPVLRNEDWLAAFLGLVVISAVLAGVRPEAPKFKWATDGAAAAKIAETRAAVDALAADAAVKADPALAAAATALQGAVASGDRAAVGAAAKKVGELAKATKDAAAKKKASGVAKGLADAGSTLAGVFSAKNLAAIAVIGVAYLLLTAIGVVLLGGNLGRYLLGFPVVYVLATAAQIAAGNSTVSYWGLEYVIFALVIGLVIGNLVGLPAWLREAVRTEYFIKAGLVILGTSILFTEILQAGALGILQAVLVVSVVWYACFWLARKLRVDEEFAVMLSTAVSICGVSAAIAACGAIQGDKKKLSYVTSLVLLVAVPMMVLMPWVVRSLGIPDVVGGAWLGGTLDTSGSVVAAGALISDAAMKTGVIVKFSQNVLLGVAAFALSVWWTFRAGKTNGQRVSGRVIWERFPKFVIGFVAASLVFSFALDPATIEATKGSLGALRTAFFALAFFCIGLETRLSNLVSMGNGRPAIAFVAAQGFNVVWTLALAFLIFGGYFFAVPVFK